MESTNSFTDLIVANGLCTGCGICQAIAGPKSIEMRMSAEGYLRPVTLKALQAGSEQEIKEVCPGASVQPPPSNGEYHTIWGALKSVTTGHAKDPQVHRQGSSGGVISAVAIYLLETKKVDFVAQISASSSKPLENQLQLSLTRDDVIRAAGSRYAPSAPLAQLADLLAMNKRFALIGKPCDIAALRRYLSTRPEARQSVPYLLSFMCAGIPSQLGTDEVVQRMGSSKEKVVTFRYRGDGWPGMTRAVERDGSSFEMDYNTSWGEILGKHLQFRCKICADGTGESADIVCADAWYGKDGYPDFSEREGRSLILARTTEGESLLAELVAAAAIQRESLPVEDIALMQPYQLLRKRLALGRGLATWLARGRTVKYRRMKLLSAALQERPLTVLRNAWGTYKRAHGEDLGRKKK
jgi:coenzyme F420 hydrogenase subunit beta